jgi:CRISPR-associated protein Cas1
MKKLLNTLYISTENSYLSKEGETIVIKVDGTEKHKFPIHILQGVVCFGNVLCSPSLMHFCATSNVAISFLNTNGKFMAKVQGPVSGNVLLRREQYRFADNPIKTEHIASMCILGKLANSRSVVMRAAREQTSLAIREKLNHASQHLLHLIQNIDTKSGVDSLRGMEGEAAKTYFDIFDHLILAQKENFFFKERSRRPPLDNMNALLSFIYTLIMHDFTSALETVGLDPAVGFLHRDRPGRAGLALDLMEECRSFIGDRLALTLVNRLQVNPKGFIRSESGDVRMTEETRKEILTSYQKRKQEEITHPFLNERIAIGLIPHVQSMLLARYIRGDLDGYPPFIIK